MCIYCDRNVEGLWIGLNTAVAYFLAQAGTIYTSISALAWARVQASLGELKRKACQALRVQESDVQMW